MSAPLLSVEGVSVDLPTPRGALRAVDNVDLSLAPGRTLGVVGESGCGKTMLSRAILQLLPKRARLSGRVMLAGRDLAALPPEALRRLRGPELAVVFQDPMTSLNPVLTIGTQIIETLQAHLGMDTAAATRRGAELLAAVGIPAPEQRLRQYPHQLSGGMRQRVAIAIALSCEPKLLIADEPTTALDVTVQAQILDLLAREQQRRHMAMILITHDLGVVAGRTDEVAVMYAGRIVERAPTPHLFSRMRMPYTEALLAAIPKLDSPPHTPLPAIAGRPPDPTRPLTGCSFAPRCRYADERCRTPSRRSPIPSAPARSTPAGIRSACPRSRAHDALAVDREPHRRIRRRRQDAVRRVRREPRGRPRRDAGPGGRIGLRQVDPGPRRPAAAPPDRRPGHASTAPSSPGSTARRCA